MQRNYEVRCETGAKQMMKTKTAIPRREILIGCAATMAVAGLPFQAVASPPKAASAFAPQKQTQGEIQLRQRRHCCRRPRCQRSDDTGDQDDCKQLVYRRTRQSSTSHSSSREIRNKGGSRPLTPKTSRAADLGDDAALEYALDLVRASRAGTLSGSLVKVRDETRPIVYSIPFPAACA